jgi:hypothetical protein
MLHLLKVVPLPTVVVLTIILMVLSVWPGISSGGEFESDEGGAVSGPDSSAHGDFTPGTKVQFQAGMMYRFAGNRFDEGSEPYLVTLGLSIPFYWDRKHSTWGTGLHVAFDGDGGPRVGPKLIWRTPLGLSQSGFFQLGTCIYLFSSDDEINASSSTGGALNGQVVMPGFFLEAEVGISDLLSITAAMEAIRVEYGMNSPSETLGETTDLHYYVGGKMGGWGGAVLVVIGVAVAGAVVASSFN